MSEKRFVCIDIGYGDDWYITDNGKRLSEMEIVDLLNEQQSNIKHLETYCGDLEADAKMLMKENEQLRQVVEEYRKTNKHLSELCVDASKNGYLPPWRLLR